MKSIYCLDMSLAAILISLGVPRRPFDPVTREIRTYQGKEARSTKFWFDTTDPEKEAIAKEAIAAYTACGKEWEAYTLDKEHPIYWMKGALENRTMWLDLYHNNATEMRVIEDGDRTIYIGPKVSEKNKTTLKKLL